MSALSKAPLSNRKLVTIAHLYPREMNIYGDLGNIITLRKRLEWRGYEVKVLPVEIGESFDFGQVDLVFGGGGQDRGQVLVGKDLLERAPQLRQAAMNGLPMLLICGLYQLFGHGFKTASGEEIPGIAIFDAETIATDTRMIGNVVLETRWGRLVGFENHSGATELLGKQEALGRVVRGYGNSPKAKQEGAIINNVVGTYLHGSLLPKNPALADWLISKVLEHRGITELEPLDDSLEQQAAQVASTRPQ